MTAGVSYTFVGLFAGLLLWLLASGGGAPRPPTGEQPEQAEISRLHGIRDQTAAIRGLDIASEVREGYLSREDLSAYIEDVYSVLNPAQRAEIDTLAIMMRMLRMIGPDDDLLEISAKSASLGIAGFYDYDQKSLVVVADGLKGGANEESTFAHEYTHALQDRRFDLTKFLVFEPEDDGLEYGRTLSCVVEGDASVSALKYLEGVYGDDWIDVLIADLSSLEEELRSVAEFQSSVPSAILRYTLFNYNECASFVLEVWEEGGWEAVNALYGDPPTTTEQVMHPERYFEGEGPLPLELANLRASLGLGWRLAQGAAFGEFDLFNYLASAGLARFAALSAAEGWGAGKLNVYTLGGGEGIEVLLHIALLWDGAADLIEFELAFETALARQGLELLARGPDSWVWADLREGSHASDHGHAVWDSERNRVDLLFSTDEAVVWNAREALDSSR